MTKHLRRALVTGASSGIGQAIAERLVTDGWQVVGISRTGRVPEGALSVSADLAGDGVREAVAQAQNLLGGVDAYVGAAGSTYEQLAARADLEQVNNQLRLHYLANYEAISLLLPGMVRARWGRIVLLSSVVAQSGMAGLTAYGAAKGGPRLYPNPHDPVAKPAPARTLLATHRRRQAGHAPGCGRTGSFFA